ncbi:ankyrin repeat domain-containing protein [Neolewinella antarctica]|uniref:Ankyrin repeat domain-containing protein n=1 Tax=Neolewinella antarctica TaxID=442734 RepID=A0ABX0XD14_9BACT|nr:ankyrin repeat domain-containing protein [Neolewinella antarctica]NJC26826.1 hypothetical protein [Neolewinella antarctica]
MSLPTTDQLFAAIRAGDSALVARIIAANPALANQPDGRGFLPVVLATYVDDLAVTQALVAAGADPNADTGGGTALMGAAFKGHLPVIQYLIKAGAKVNATNAQGGSALSFARMGNHKAVVTFLLEQGAK